MQWRPSADLASLRAGAFLRRSVRQWMETQDILEVCTPVISRHATTDPHVLSIETQDGRYLHTSPEFAMKRLLAAHAQNREHSREAVGVSGKCSAQPDIYQIAQVFRADESGRFHNTEFSLLEWYRVGIDHHQLMIDVENLLSYLCTAFSFPWEPCHTRQYGVEIQSRLGVWPEDLDVSRIKAYFDKAGRHFTSAIGEDVDAALDLFVDEFVLPEFPTDRFTFLTDYPVSQAALAKTGLDQRGRAVAQRFEVYFGHLELGNGFHELNDAEIQRQRFSADLLKRDAMGIAQVPMDRHLLSALQAGIPDCAGIAIGLDRLHMILGKHKHIQQVLSFDDQRA